MATNYPVERDATCPICGAKPNKPCYGNGPMPPNSHPNRGIKALHDEIDRLRIQLEESQTRNALSNKEEVEK